MKIAIWIIAIVEVIRALQNMIQIIMVAKSNSNPQFKRVTDAFIESLNKTDAEFIQEIVKGAEQ